MPLVLGTSSIPVGMSIMHAGTTAPPGFLKENGAAVSRTAYAALFAEIGTTHGAGDGATTFNVPDSRGEFFRGLDDGRGVDSGRTIGAAQGGQNLSHAHGVYDPSHAHSGAEFGGSNNFTPGGSGGQFRLAGAGGVYNTAGSATGIGIYADGGTEARPRNVARLACIKY